EQVALVVVLPPAAGGGPQHAVADLVVHAQLHAAADRRVEPGGLFAHPGHGGPVHGLRLGDGVVGEPAGEGLRQQHHVGGAAQGSDEAAVVFAVGVRVVPAGGALDQGDAQT